MAMLEVKDLNVHYGVIHALKGISMEVREGEIVALIGANGAGKTTLLHAISGIQKKSGGDILFEGESLNKAGARKIVSLGITQVPEGRRIFSGMSVYENLMMGAFLRRDKEGIKADLKNIYSRFPILEKRSTQDASTLSGGEQQMLAMGRALMAWRRSWSRRSSISSGRSMSRGRRSCWSSRMPVWRCLSQTAPMSWRPGTSC